MSEGLLDRLLLTEDRIEGMAHGLEEVAKLPSHVGEVLEKRIIDDGIELSCVRVPMGVVAVIYEARPNVTADAAGIALKSGNAVVLRGGSAAEHSNRAIAAALAHGVHIAGLSPDTCVLLDSTNRAHTDELMQARGLVDLLIPRGSAGLINHCMEYARVPVIETGTGNCHTYVHKSANIARATNIILNAKTQRTGVCNACESVLVDAELLDDGHDGAAIVPLLQGLANAGVTLHVDDEIGAVCAAYDILSTPATEDDWGMEYLSLDISIKTLHDGVDEAVFWINTYGTHHSEAIVADETNAVARGDIETFLNGVDAAAVYANASTRYSDGGCFGLGAEIGISTQKLHVRGPFALEALTTYKYQLRGNGQTRK